MLHPPFPILQYVVRLQNAWFRLYSICLAGNKGSLNDPKGKKHVVIKDEYGQRMNEMLEASTRLVTI
jgi:hypothetical protein